MNTDHDLSEEHNQPLHGLRILDISTMIAAPVASTLLADFGAEVVKVELPESGDVMRQLPPHKDGAPLWWKVTNRNKKGITLDLRKEEGKEIFRRLIPKFDVLTENFRPGTLDRYGFSKEILMELNPDLIILRITGYGQSGPMASRPGFARIAEAYSGFTSLCGIPGQPPMHIGYPVADGITGMFGAIGILIACFRQKTRKDAHGEEIDLSLVDSMLRMLEFSVIEYDQLGVVRERSGNRSQYAGPSNVYLTEDKRWFSMSASAQPVFERFARAIGRPDLIENPDYATNSARVENADALDQIIIPWIGSHTQDEIMEIFSRDGVSGGPVNNARDVFESKHLQYRKSFVEVDDSELGTVTMQNVIPVMTEAPGKVHSTGPTLGQHNDEILSSLIGLSEEEIDDLSRKGVI
ncbi:CoA transferase [Sneathiella marina]|uniref:CoA transferase n=1 Tax=Sneathiella marina TaxID=2950108 RepID=A0ABY4W9P6_9PROT|nr:CoA transferase [Sneathiella marina]USG62485.1 CoA transferase [Sneathiella marina]